jgi:hypothetical protein
MGPRGTGEKWIHRWWLDSYHGVGHTTHRRDIALDMPTGEQYILPLNIISTFATTFENFILKPYPRELSFIEAPSCLPLGAVQCSLPWVQCSVVLRG